MKHSNKVFLYIIPLSISRKKLIIFINNQKVAKGNWSTPFKIAIAKNTKCLVNIKEGLTKDHFFELTFSQDKLIYMKKKMDIIGSRIGISQTKDFKNEIMWVDEWNEE